MEKVRELYNKIAEKYTYGRISRKNYYRELLLKPVFNVVNFRDRRVLDIGTGPGWFLFEIADVIREGIGIDISEEMVRLANELNKYQNLTFKVANALNLEFDTESFDAVSAFGVFEYATDLSPFLREINRVLKKDGFFVMTCRNKEFIFLILEKLLNKLTKHKRKFARIEYAVEDIVGILKREGFEVVYFRSTFYIPLAWAVYDFIPSSIKKVYVNTILYINKLFEKILPRKGGTLLIVAIKRGSYVRVDNG